MVQPKKPNSGNYIVWTSLGIVVAAFLFSARDGGESFLGIVGSLWTILFVWTVVLSLAHAVTGVRRPALGSATRGAWLALGLTFLIAVPACLLAPAFDWSRMSRP